MNAMFVNFRIHVSITEPASKPCIAGPRPAQQRGVCHHRRRFDCECNSSWALAQVDVKEAEVRAPKTPAEDGSRGFVPGPWCATRLAAVLAEQVRQQLCCLAASIDVWGRGCQGQGRDRDAYFVCSVA